MNAPASPIALRFVMTMNGKNIAVGEASAVMTYEFQKALWEGISSNPTELLTKGRFATLVDLIGLDLGQALFWEVKLGAQTWAFYATGLVSRPS